MRQDLGMRLLMEVMNWDDAYASEALKAMDRVAAYKYDEYADFLAGARFIENLAKWLQQFSPSDREAAFRFVRERLIFISSAEIGRLVETFFPRTIYYQVLEEVSKQLRVAPFMVLQGTEGQDAFSKAIRKTLFVGLSDGARIDQFRRSNVGRIKNDQVLLTTEVDRRRWKSAHKSLQKDIAGAKFERVYLIDDFTASGTTLCRQEDDGSWTGKLPRFYEIVSEYMGDVVDNNAPIHIHHFIGTRTAENTLRQREREIRAARGAWFAGPIDFSFGLMLSENVPLTEEQDKDFLRLCDHYYDTSIETVHGEAAGERSLKRGYAGCALPVVIHHNTPNNSVALLWAESAGKGGANNHAMRPLFRRRQRHS